MKVLLKLWPVLALCALACRRPEGDTPTSGRLAVMSADCIAPVAQKQIEEFQRLYEKAAITMQVASSRETVAQFLRGEVRAIFLDRQLHPEEKQIARARDIAIDSFCIAHEGVAVIVHPENPVAALNLAQIGAIYRGEIRNWREAGGPHRPILPVALSRNSGTAEFVLAQAVRDTVFAPRTYVCASSAQLLATIAQRREALGFISSAWLNDSTVSRGAHAGKVKVLKLAQDSTSNPVALYQAAVHRGDYPLRRSLYVFTRDRRLDVAVGLTAFVTSAAGQKLMLNAGLVPATMPVKLVKFRS